MQGPEPRGGARRLHGALGTQSSGPEGSAAAHRSQPSPLAATLGTLLALLLKLDSRPSQKNGKGGRNQEMMGEKLGEGSTGLGKMKVHSRFSMRPKGHLDLAVVQHLCSS